MSVSKALYPSEQIRLWLSDWLTPISGVITLIIGSVSGIIGWGIGKSKRKESKQKETAKN